MSLRESDADVGQPYLTTDGRIKVPNGREMTALYSCRFNALSLSCPLPVVEQSDAKLAAASPLEKSSTGEAFTRQIAAAVDCSLQSDASLPSYYDCEVLIATTPTYVPNRLAVEMTVQRFTKALFHGDVLHHFNEVSILGMPRERTDDNHLEKHLLRRLDFSEGRFSEGRRKTINVKGDLNEYGIRLTVTPLTSELVAADVLVAADEYDPLMFTPQGEDTYTLVRMLEEGATGGILVAVMSPKGMRRDRLDGELRERLGDMLASGYDRMMNVARRNFAGGSVHDYEDIVHMQLWPSSIASTLSPLRS